MVSLLQKLAEQKAREKGKDLFGETQRPKQEQIQPKQVDTFHGLGFTKREMGKTQREYDRETQKSIDKGEDIAADEARDKFESALDQISRALTDENTKRAVTYDPSQVRAIVGILSNRVSILIGAAGTGKTTITREIITQLAKIVPVTDLRAARFETVHDGDQTERMLASLAGNPDDKEISPAICGSSFTGRAAQQFKRAVPDEWKRTISTIHSLLGYAPTFEDVEDFDPITRKYYLRTKRVFRPSFGVGCKLPYHFYILDEASMVPIPLFNELVDAMPENARVLLIGDIHQLPPVMGKGVLGYAMQKWPVFELTTIHRQAADNPIIANAHRVLRGAMLQKDKEHFHMIDGSKYGSAGDFAVYTRQVMELLWKKGRYDPYRDSIIVANSKPDIPLGAPSLNMHFVTMFNPERRENGVIVNKRIQIHAGISDKAYAIGDKVMMLANINDVEPPITNGMTGIVESININGRYDEKRSQFVEDMATDPIDLDLDEAEISLEEMAGEQDKPKGDSSMEQRQASHVMTIRFDTGQTYVCSTAGDYSKVTYGYAVTCHKMQGGEAPSIFVVVHSAQGRMLSQEWLYTALTRARQNVYLIYNDRGLKMALKTQKVHGNTLQEKIRNYIIEAKRASGDKTTPEEDAIMLRQNPWQVDRAKFPILFNPQEVPVTIGGIDG